MFVFRTLDKFFLPSHAQLLARKQTKKQRKKRNKTRTRTAHCVILSFVRVLFTRNGRRYSRGRCVVTAGSLPRPWLVACSRYVTAGSRVFGYSLLLGVIHSQWRSDTLSFPFMAWRENVRIRLFPLRLRLFERAVRPAGIS